MYNREIVEANIQATILKTKKPLFRYKPEYIDEATAHLQTLAELDDKGRAKRVLRALLPDETEFIRNERLMCALDYDHWAMNYDRIRDSNTQEMIKFKRNFAQDVVNQVYCDMQARGVPIMLQGLKARQLGWTTDTSSRIEHRVLFIPNTSGVLASSDEDKTWKLAEMIERSLRVQPWWLVPDDLKQYRSNEVFIEIPSRNTTLGIQHGRQTSGISRGDSINCYHISEVPDFDKKEVSRLIDASLMKAMHPTNMTIGVLESTANGRNDYWHKRWLENQAEYFGAGGLEYPLFLPWFLGKDIYPTEGWLLGVPIPLDWQPPDFVVDHAAKAREYVLQNKLLYTTLGLDWHMPLAQMWYYWKEYEKAKRKDDLASFYSEMPANDLEAFQSKRGAVFSIELLQSYQDKAKAPVGIYSISGTEVPSELWPVDTNIDKAKPPIQVRHYYTPLDKLCVWDFIPKLTSHPKGLHQLTVWEYPEKEHEYGVSLDGAEGKGLDRVVLSVVRKGTPLRTAEQVAELASDTVATLEIWPVWLALLKYYSPVHRGDITYAMASPEMNRGGDAALMQLRSHGWPNVYIRSQLDDFSRLSTTKLGWETTPKSRDQLIQWLLLAIKGKWAQVNSTWLVDELRDFVVDELQTKIRLQAGAGCFVEGTQITMNDGSEKAIEDFPIRGSVVMSHTGKSQPVVKAFKHPYIGDLYRIKALGLPDALEATPTHPFFVRPATKKKMLPKDKEGLALADWAPASSLKAGDYLAVPKRVGLFPVGFTEDQLYVMGFWLAEGHYVYRRGKLVGIGFTNTDRKYLERIQQTLTGWFIKDSWKLARNAHTTWWESRRPTSDISKGRMRESSTKPVYDFVFRSIEATEAFVELFGETHCHDKCLSNWLYEHSGLLPLVAGFIDGDGSQRKNQQGDINIYSTSKILINQMRQIMLDAGIWCTYRQGSARNREEWKPSWIINVKARYVPLFPKCKLVARQTRSQFHVIEDASYFYTPIKEVTRISYKGPVYNLEVLWDNSYIANGIAVHNSHDDRIFSFIISMICLHGLDVYRQSTPHWRTVEVAKAELLAFAREPKLTLPIPRLEENLLSSSVVYYSKNSGAGPMPGLLPED